VVYAYVDGELHLFNRIEQQAHTEMDVDLTGDQFGRGPVQIAETGQLYGETLVFHAHEMHQETLERAARLAERSGLTEVAHQVRQHLGTKDR
jgi:hypothetical protein